MGLRYVFDSFNKWKFLEYDFCFILPDNEIVYEQESTLPNFSDEARIVRKTFNYLVCVNDVSFKGYKNK
jgi:hypothetical protein